MWEDMIIHYSDSTTLSHLLTLIIKFISIAAAPDTIRVTSLVRYNFTQSVVHVRIDDLPLFLSKICNACVFLLTRSKS